MTEHESNLYDLYAGLAMVGWMINGDYSEKVIPHMAFDMAEEMIRLRKERADGKTKTQATRSVPDMAVPEMEKREDSDTQGIAALKKAPRTRHKSA